MLERSMNNSSLPFQSCFLRCSATFAAEFAACTAAKAADHPFATFPRFSMDMKCKRKASNTVKQSQDNSSTATAPLRPTRQSSRSRQSLYNIAFLQHPLTSAFELLLKAWVEGATSRAGFSVKNEVGLKLEAHKVSLRRRQKMKKGDSLHPKDFTWHDRPDEENSKSA